MNSIFIRIIDTRLVYGLAIALGVINGMVFDFSFDSHLLILPPILSLLSLIGFLWVIQQLNPKRAAKFGYIFGLGLFTWGIHWVHKGLELSDGTSAALAITANIILVAYLSLYWLLASYLITKLSKYRLQRLLLAAPIIVLLEWVRSVFLLGFPWLSIGYGWIDTPIKIFSSFGGVWIISFIVISFCALVLLPIRIKQKTFSLIGLFIICTIIFIVTKPNTSNNPKKTATVALVQGNMPVITTYDNERMQKNIGVYSSLTDTVLNSEKIPDIIIWPESAIPYFHTDIIPFQIDLQEKQRKLNFDFISGINYADIDKGEFYNAAIHQNADSDILATPFYLKHHLLPFGEYVPFGNLLDFFDIPMSSYSQGDLIQQPFVAAGIVISPSICFEMVFGNEIRQNAIQSDVLLNISNDAWFGTSKAQTQHFNITRMRAIENHKSVIRATNNGITAIILPDGSVQKSLPQFSRGILAATINANSEVTLYAKFGDLPLLTLLLILVLIIITHSKYCQNKTANSV